VAAQQTAAAAAILSVVRLKAEELALQGASRRAGRRFDLDRRVVTVEAWRAVCVGVVELETHVVRATLDSKTGKTRRCGSADMAAGGGGAWPKLITAASVRAASARAAAPASATHSTAQHSSCCSSSRGVACGTVCSFTGPRGKGLEHAVAAAAAAATTIARGPAPAGDKRPQQQ
jgi:hypothetical protein